MRTNYLTNIGLIVLTIVALFLFGEVTIRLIVWINGQKSFHAVMNNLPDLKEKTYVTLGDIIQPSKHQEVIYELRPNIKDVIYRNGIVRTNSQGWRSNKGYQIEKGTNTVRIVGLGDSYMFGQGVNQGKDIMSILEKELNDKFSGKKWEVINAAVPGYNAVMEIAILEKKLLMFKPDIVIIEFIANDFDLPNFIYDSWNWKDISKSYLVQFISTRSELLRLSFKLRDAPLANDWGFERNPAKVPKQYKGMVGWEAYVKAMRMLDRLRKRWGFEVISFVTYKNRNVYNLGKQLGFYVLYNLAYYWDNPSIVLYDKHPSVLGHKKGAEELINFMISEGIIEKFL